MLRSRIAVFVALVCLLVASTLRVTRTQGAVQYGWIDLGTLRELASTADDIDWRGRVVGVTTERESGPFCTTAQNRSTWTQSVARLEDFAVSQRASDRVVKSRAGLIQPGVPRHARTCMTEPARETSEL
jgi:cytochrome c biogenesis protein ResB